MPMPAPAADRPWKVDRNLQTILGLALLAALFMVLVVFPRQGLVDGTDDPYGYGAIARGFVEHGFVKLTRRAASLYPTFLSLIYSIGLGNRAVQLIQIGLHVATCALVYVMGRHLFNPRTGLIAGIFCAVHPMLLRYVPDLHMECWLTFFFTWTIWRAIKFWDRPSVINGIALGAVGMIGTLSKGILLPVLVTFVVGWLWQTRPRATGRPRRIAGALAIVATMALMLAPWTYRNYRTSGKVVLLTPGTPDAFLRGYIFTRLEFATLQKPPYTDAENESNQLFRRIAHEAGTTWEQDEVADDANNSRLMKRWIVERPFDTLRKCVVGVFTFWYEMTSFKNSLIPLVLATINWGLAVVGLRRAQEERRPYWLLLAPIVVTNLLVAALIPLGRYSVPVLPALSLLAAFGIDTLLERRRGGLPVFKTSRTTAHAVQNRA
jgi:4-amino-4-deoxy-L-arabinose transferase-like glycosyltransferase